MLNLRIGKKAVILVLIIVLLGGMYFFIGSLKIGPGLPPSEGMPMWYIPGYSTIPAENGIIVEDRTVGDHFMLIGDRKKACPPTFPSVSQYCGYANYKQKESNDLYLIVSWYFDDEKKFLQSEKDLYQYLEEHGRVSIVELDISEEISDEIKRRENRSAWGPTFGPKSFDVTKYESEITSGYFLVYKNPFIEGRDDYFIVYYGAMGSVDFSKQRPLLEKLIATSYYLNEHGEIGGLKDIG